MKSLSSMFKIIDDAHEALSDPEFNIGWHYFIYDSPSDPDIDFHLLMDNLGFEDEAVLWNNYFNKYPTSNAQPWSEGADNFFKHLMEVGIFEHNEDVRCLVFTHDAQTIYNDLTVS